MLYFRVRVLYIGYYIAAYNIMRNIVINLFYIIFSIPVKRWITHDLDSMLCGACYFNSVRWQYHKKLDNKWNKILSKTSSSNDLICVWSNHY